MHLLELTLAAAFCKYLLLVKNLTAKMTLYHSDQSLTLQPAFNLECAALARS